MDQIYRQQIIDHYKNPRNTGVIADADHKAELKNLSCGDEVTVYLNVGEKNITDLKYEATGCAICIASMSLLSEELIGGQKDIPIKMKYEDILELIGIELSPSRIKCAHLGLLAVQKALEKIVID